MASSLALTARYGRRALLRPVPISVTSRWQTTGAPKNNEFEDRTLNTPLPSPGQEDSPSLMERSEKGFFARIFDKYSFSQQTNRILIAESLLQAATRQASDP
jgi:hypothetical protein